MSEKVEVLKGSLRFDEVEVKSSRKVKVAKVFYVSPSGGKYRAVSCVLITSDGYKGFGQSVCSPEDNFNLVYGKSLAQARAFEALGNKPQAVSFKYLSIDYWKQVAAFKATNAIKETKRKKEVWVARNVFKFLVAAEKFSRDNELNVHNIIHETKELEKTLDYVVN